MASATFAQCRAAASAVRQAEHSPAATDTIRPRSVLGMVRSRAPLAIVLHLAAVEARLVWQSERSFAVLEAPRYVSPVRRAAGS